MISSLLHLVGLRPRVYYTLTNFRGGGGAKAPLAPPPQYANATNITDRNIVGHVCDLYQRSNSVISDFNVCDSVSLDNFHQTYYMHM